MVRVAASIWMGASSTSPVVTAHVGLDCDDGVATAFAAVRGKKEGRGPRPVRATKRGVSDGEAKEEEEVKEMVRPRRKKRVMHKKREKTRDRARRKIRSFILKVSLFAE